MATATVYLVGDGADGGATPKQVAARIPAGATLFYLGDVYGPLNNNGDSDGFTNGYEPVYGSTSANNLKPTTYPVMGNHDWADADKGGPTLHSQAGAYEAYWGAKAKPDGVNHYYTVTINGWQFIVLNSEELGGSAWRGISPTQLAWLKERLEAAPFNIVLCHRPRYSADTTHGDAVDLGPVWDACIGRAACWVSGHAHSTQRVTRDGLVQLVAGGGGHSLTPDDSRYALDFGNDTQAALLKLDLNDNGTLAGTFIRGSDGVTLDSFTITHPPRGSRRPIETMSNGHVRNESRTLMVTRDASFAQTTSGFARDDAGRLLVRDLLAGEVIT